VQRLIPYIGMVPFDGAMVRKSDCHVFYMATQKPWNITDSCSILSITLCMSCDSVTDECVTRTYWVCRAKVLSANNRLHNWLQIQFTTAMFMGINGITSGCDFPLWMQYVLVIYMISFIVLFGNFYAKAYIEKVRLCGSYVILSQLPSFMWSR